MSNHAQLTDNDILSKHERASAIQLNPAEDPEAAIVYIVGYIVGYIQRNCFVKNTFALAPMESYVDSVELYRQALLLGMEIHTGAVIAKLMRSITYRGHQSPLDVLNVATQLPSTDKFYQAAVRCMGCLQLAGKIDRSAWETWLEQHTAFKADVDAWIVHKQNAQCVASYEQDFPALG